MTKIKQSPKLPAETRRNQLMMAAKTLFVKKGYRGTTIDDIAKRAHLTKGAFYFYFRKKEEILLALIKSVADGNREALCKEIGKNVTPSQFLRVLVGLHCQCRASEYGDLVDIWVQAWRVPRIKHFIVEHLKRVVNDHAQSLDMSGLPRGITRREICLLIVGIVDGLSVMNLLMPDEVDLDRQLLLFDKLTQPRRLKTGKESK
ncbi:MAG TPA: TetR/AcrR family transcriptional regulator [candidate division Zixibacteria bacterium]|nr:TetR/AcrR family transcriptional regulator [candidate division Zixibacteria bacterium]